VTSISAQLNKTTSNSEPPLKSLQAALMENWKLALSGAVISFFLASILLTGWPGGLWPDISYPYSYQGDSLFHAWMAKSVSEGWLFNNARSGYPFGSNFIDFPGSDFGSHLIIKVLALLSSSSVTATNLFFLFSFPIVFISSFCVIRTFGVSRAFSFVGALLFTFIPFHFQRVSHLFYTWYFVAPIFFYLAFFIFRFSSSQILKTSKKRLWLKYASITIALLAISSFGVYYTLFGVILIFLAGILNLFKTGKPLGLKRALLIIFILTSGALLNITPNLIGKYEQGENQEAAKRFPVESEIYALKLMQLILPRADHRISYAGKLTQSYNTNSPLINENTTSTLGIIASLGLLTCFLYILISLSGTRTDHRLTFLAASTLVLFLFATTGGLGALFAFSISPSIRGWNRASIFIAFGCVLAFFLALQLFLEKFSPKIRPHSLLAAVIILIVGMYDQTASRCKECNMLQKLAYDNDRNFVSDIERSLPEGAAIYQLPYMPFPETPPLNRLDAYQLATGFIHSKNLHWSYGGMKGRDGDMYYRSLANEPIEKQLEVVKRLGFNGIYIDRRGYSDNASALIANLTTLLGAPPLLNSSNGELAFFKLTPTESTILAGLSATQIMEKSGYYADHLGPRYSANLQEGIAFTRPGWPAFIKDVSGFSSPEPWGRWSDGNARLVFASALPQTFTLIMTAQAFGPNADKPAKILIGTREYEIKLESAASEVRIQVNLMGQTTNTISFTPSKPTSPSKLGISNDVRELGIGFISLRLEL
jgi:phosphoglycerol transferase